MVKITGGGGFRQALESAKGPAMIQAVTQALFVFGNRIQDAAQISITTGSQSGKNHVPSAPGSPPNNDTGVLANNIEALIVAPLHIEVQSRAPYAAIQEYGGTINHPGGTPYFIGKDGKARFVSKSGFGAYHNLPVTKPHTITLPERPYMRPALAEKKQEGIALVAKAVSHVLKGGTVR